jgi:FADH2 O2-dependent halogenase
VCALPSMKQKNNQPYDILIAGAGFAGSLTALILHQMGYKICLIEKDRHPRFAIGESSTPVADMILRSLSSQYQLPWLQEFSRYGSWQLSHSQIVCGLKRGFSYFKHHPHKAFSTTPDHSNELLVAASTSDDQSDTNWLRADFDGFLVEKVKQSGIAYFDLTEIESAKKNGSWEFAVNGQGQQSTIEAAFFIDATGSSGLLEKLLKVPSSAEGYLTNSFAIFSHFNQVPRWTEMLHKSGIPTSDFPYNADHSALHQILDEGWLWMLRFNDERISLGFVLDQGATSYSHLPAQEIWEGLARKYPSVGDLLKEAVLAPQPGRLIRSGRLQRKMKYGYGSGWVALPHSIGFVDPLFSSGIAHTLSGVEKVVRMIGNFWGKELLMQDHLQQYQQSVFEELELVDYLVAGSYRTFTHFDLFIAWSMCYFAATIAHEQRRLRQQDPGYFLNADDPAIKKIILESYDDLVKITSNNHPTEEQITWFTNRVRKRIQPFNTAGLLDPALKNMYRHTAAAL